MKGSSANPASLILLIRLTVASILAKLMLDAPTIAAGLLHDTVEDCENVTLEVIEKEFGQEVALLVDGVTKLRRA